MKNIFLGLLFLSIPLITLSQWIQVPTPTTNNIADITFTDNLHGYAAGYEHILTSTDGGNSWQIALTQPSLCIADLSFPDINTGYTVGDYGLLFKTTNAGTTWLALNSPTSVVLRGVYFLNPDTGFICGQHEEIFRTEDGGITWTQKSTGDYWLRQFSFPTHQIGYCAGDGPNVYKTTDGGNTWNKIQIGYGETNLTDIFFVSPDIGYIAGLYGFLAKTVNGGINWQILNSGTSNVFEGIYFFDALNGIAIGEEGLILKTADGGITWNQEESGTTSFLRDAFFFNTEEGFMCGHDGLIMKNGNCLPHADFFFEINALTVNFTDNSTSATSYFWNLGDGTTSTDKDPVHTYTSSGDYDVCLRVQNSCGTDSVCKIIHIDCPAPVSDFVYDANFLTVNFTDSSTTGFLLSRLWDFGDSTYSTLQDPTHVYPEPGIYQVCLTVTDSCGTDSVYKLIQVNCSVPISRFVYEVSLLKIYFYDSSYTAFNPSYLWDFGDSTYSTVQNPSHQYSDPGIYQVCLTVTDSCGTDTSCQDVGCFLPMKLNIQVIPSETNDRMVQFSDETPGTNRWAWDFGDGSTSPLRNPSHLYKEYGTYKVCLTAGNQQYQGTSCDTLLLNVNPALHEENPVIIYPNPTDGKLFIRFFREFSSVRIILQDLTGRTILEKQLTNIELTSPSTIDLSPFQKGVYFVSLKSDGFGKTWKIVIK
jgi:PKD repeat protein